MEIWIVTAILIITLYLLISETLPIDITAIGIEFGNAYFGSIHGIKFRDLNADGIWQDLARRCGPSGGR